MPTSARKSSLGASRRAQRRVHQPFHADDLGRGKRTGLTVPTIEHRSDDFEPFDEILSHADTRAAWHGQNKRPGSSKKRKSVLPVYEDDDGGDMSMEFEDYGKLAMSSPSQYSTRTNTRRTYRYECEHILFQRATPLITFGRSRWVIFASRRPCFECQFRHGAISSPTKVNRF